MEAALRQLDASKRFQHEQNKEFAVQSERLEEALFRNQELEALLEDTTKSMEEKVKEATDEVRKHCKFSQERVEIQLSESASQLDSALKEVTILRR